MLYTAYCNTYCNMDQPYCNILQYAFCCIVTTLVCSVLDCPTERCKGIGMYLGLSIW